MVSGALAMPFSMNPLYASGFGVYNENIAIIGGIEVSNF
jgi:hypothetical protein